MERKTKESRGCGGVGGTIATYVLFGIAGALLVASVIYGVAMVMELVFKALVYFQ